MKNIFSIIDTHCHLDIAVFKDRLPDILRCSMAKGVTDFILPGYISSGWDRLINISAKYPNLHAAPGLHPCYLSEHKTEDIEKLDTLCQTGIPIAIGEIGLDLHCSPTSVQDQKHFFEQQIHIAKNHNLPILLHVRKAHDQVASIIRKLNFLNGGIVHAFNGSLQQANTYLQMGFKLGYGGNITYERATRIRKIAAELPLSAIVLETDAPDIPLAKRRDTHNSPEYLPEILDTLSTLRPESKEAIALQTCINVKEVLTRIDKQTLKQN